jgi:uncharacterized protein YjbK
MSPALPAGEAREVEFKFAVSGAEAFTRLLDHLGKPRSLLQSGILQVNHLFDTPALALHDHGSIVRLREQGGDYQLTVKGDTAPAATDGVLTERIEYESPVDVDAARTLLRTRRISGDRLAGMISDHADAVHDLLRTAGVHGDLVYIGCFSNERIKLPVILPVEGARCELLFELDSSEFPDGVTNTEIEVEITGRDDAEAIRSVLLTLLAQAGIDWQTTSNKAERFFAALGRPASATA